MDLIKRQLNALDLFAGAGGSSQGMRDAGINIVAAIEFNPKIAKTYKFNHPETYLIVEDIRKISASNKDLLFDEKKLNIKKIFANQKLGCDIIFGGPPCQGFSMSGYRIRENKSFLEDKRNLLFKEFIRMVKYLNPFVFVLENVPGILNYDKGGVKKEILQAFQELGYDVAAKILCSADYGVPQLRNRAIFIGNRMGVDSTMLFPVPSHNETNYVTVRDAISDLPSLDAGGEFLEKSYPPTPILSAYQLKMRSNSNTIFNHISSKHKAETLEIMSMIKEGQTMKHLPAEYQTKSVHSGVYGRMEYYKPAYTITTRLNTPSVGRITHPTQNRTITPREAARLQSFPDKYKFIGDITTIGMQIGNAVPPLLAEAIGKQIIKTLEKIDYRGKVNTKS